MFSLEAWPFRPKWPKTIQNSCYKQLDVRDPDYIDKKIYSSTTTRTVCVATWQKYKLRLNDLFTLFREK